MSSCFRTAGVVPLAILAAGTPIAALSAQQPGATRDTTRLPSVVVTADRIARPLSATTSAVTVLDGAALRAAGVTHVLDALRAVPGFAVARTGSSGAQTSVFLRGGESDYVRLLVDGVPMNDPGGALDLGALTLDNVERIEVVRGPASVLYGSDAVAGVIQLFTRQARARPEASLSARAGTYATRVADATVGVRGARGGATVGLAHHASDGMLAFNNAYRNAVVSARGDGVAGGARGQLTLRHGDNRFEYPTDGAGRVADRNASRGERRFSAAAGVTRPLGARLEATLALTSLEVHGRTTDRPDGVGDTLGFFAYRSLGVVRRRGAEARLRVQPFDGQHLVLALEYGAEQQRSADSSNYDVALNRFAAARVTRSAMAQWVGDVGRTSVSVGGRYDDNDAFGGFRTGRAAVATRLWRGGRVRAGLGTSFKAPTFLETFSSAFSVGNGALTPERARAWEAGVDQGIADDRWRLSATYFDQRFRDLIQYTWVSPTAPNYFNVAAASARGVEVEVRGEAARGVSVWGNATALRTRVDDAGFQTGAGASFVRGARLLRRPPLTASLGAQLQRIPRTRLELSLTRVGVRDDRDFSSFPARPLTLPAYTRADVGGEYRVASGDGFWRSTALSLRLENAFGAGYQEVANFQAPGRVVLAGLRLGTMR